MRIFTLFLLTLFVIFSCVADDSSGVSGTIEGGLRILSVENNTEDLEFTIYRGDYIVFEFEKTGSYNFKVPELDIDSVMPVTESETPYIKMKKSGDYNFTLGERKGVFHVLELEDSNYREVTAEEGSELIKNVNPVIVDVRTEGEYQQAHIAGSILIPVQIFTDNIDKLEKFKDEDVLIYCASGNRSTVAAKMLIEAGFTRVNNLRYGIGDWIRKGYPVE